MYSILHDTEASKEVVENLFGKILKDSKKFVPRTAVFTTIMYKSVVNASLNCMRAQKKVSSHEVEWGIAAIEPTDTSPGPFDFVLAKERKPSEKGAA